MKRREFIMALGGVAVSLPVAARAQRRQLFDSHCHIIDQRFPIVLHACGALQHPAWPPRFGRTRVDIPRTLDENVLGPELARRTFWDNPLTLYKVPV